MLKRNRNNPSWPGSDYDQESTLKQSPFAIRFDPNVTQPGATLPSPLSGRPTRPAQPQHAPRSRRRRHILLAVLVILLIGLIGGGGYYLGRQSIQSQNSHHTMLLPTEPEEIATCPLHPSSFTR
jgi:hypothetical protein